MRKVSKNRSSSPSSQNSGVSALRQGDTLMRAPQQQMLVAVRQGQEARYGSAPVSGSVHPAGDRQDRDITRDLLGVLTRAERGRREFRVVGQAIVMVAELGDEGRHAGNWRYARAPPRRAPRSLDRRRPVSAGEARIPEIGKLAQKIAPVVVESDHQRVIGLDQPVQQQTA